MAITNDRPISHLTDGDLWSLKVLDYFKFIIIYERYTLKNTYINYSHKNYEWENEKNINMDDISGKKSRLYNLSSFAQKQEDAREQILVKLTEPQMIADLIKSLK